MVNLLAVIAKESSQLESLSIEKYPFDSNIIAIPQCTKMIHIKTLSGGRKENDQTVSGLIAKFEGLTLKIHLGHPPVERLHPHTSATKPSRGAVELLHPPIERLDRRPRTGITVTTLIAILDGLLNPNQIRIRVAA